MSVSNYTFLITENDQVTEVYDLLLTIQQNLVKAEWKMWRKVPHQEQKGKNYCEQENPLLLTPRDMLSQLKPAFPVCINPHDNYPTKLVTNPQHKKSQEGGDICIDSWFSLSYSRNEHNIVKQLYCKKKKNKG